MVQSVLVLCVGNICRSPIADFRLRRDLPGMRVLSAGLRAMVGHGVQTEMAALARQAGLDVSSHAARQFTPDLGTESDLILVMERAHRDEVARQAPLLLGRTFLIDQWTDGSGIADPYRQGPAAYERAFAQVMNAAGAWAERLVKEG